MTEYLCISATFLDPLFHGKNGDGEPEWPPSPLRLFQALLAGSRLGYRLLEWSDQKREAFKWLERQRPPLIIAPAVRPSTTYKFFVPRNDSDMVFDREKILTTKIAKPYRLLDGETIHYLWPLDEKEEATRSGYIDILCRSARNLIYLGWGVDQVFGEGRIMTEAEAAILPGQRWRCWEAHRPANQTLRVPKEGSLEDLEKAYSSFLKRVPERKTLKIVQRSTIFETRPYYPTTRLPIRHYAAFEFAEELAFPQTEIVVMAAMLRSLVCRLAQTDTHQFPGGTEQYVAGHLDNEEASCARFSYFPLPSVGHPNADGLIRRLIIAEPYGGDGACARWAQRRLRNAILTNQQGRKIGTLVGIWRPASRAMVKRYTSVSRTWCTVTPVILPGHDEFGKRGKGKLAKAEKLLVKSIAQSGIAPEAVDTIYMRKAPFFPGSQGVNQYRRPDYLSSQSARPAWHVRIEFREPIPGPMAIGAGRHLGLGLFVPESTGASFIVPTADANQDQRGRKA